MVLESLTNPFRAEAHPGWVALHGAVYAILALIISLWLFPHLASIVAVFLICAAAIPLLYNIIRYEEDKDYHEMEEKLLIKEHGRAVLAYFMLFVGVTLALSAAFLVMPEDMIPQAFGAQIDTYKNINPAHAIVGETAAVTGGATSMGFFTKIFLNNFNVLIFCILFSFLYGAGAIFILTWNASVIALAIGNAIRTKTAAIAQEAGMAKIAAYLSVSLKTVVLRYGIHGSLEILAYIIAGLAGGIISVAVIKHHFKSRKFEHIVIDSADLVLLSIAVLLLAGVVETWFTPLFY